MTAGYYPLQGRTMEILSENVYGRRITFDNDARIYGLEPEQRWLPHEIEDDGHPAKVGDMATPSKYMSDQLGVSAVFISGVRTFKDVRNSRGCRQVEILGLPLRWFAASHFFEYSQMVIPSHLWGTMFHPKSSEFYGH